MRWFLLTPICLLLACCMPATPETRIAANPAAYEKLSDSHKDLVRRGQIDQGMSPEAVQLAWGTPSKRYDGQNGKDRTSRWDYAGRKPVYSYNTSAYYGYGRYSRYGRWGPRYAFSVGPDITYVPYRKASVWFLNDRVSRWESAR